PLGDGLPWLATLQYEVLVDGLVTYRGNMTLLERSGGKNWDRINGASVGSANGGTWRSGVQGQTWSAEYQLANQAGTTAVAGTIPMTVQDGTSNTIFFSSVQGTVTPPDAGGRARITCIGLDYKTGIIAILIGLLVNYPDNRGTQVQGEYRLYSRQSDI